MGTSNIFLSCYFPLRMHHVASRLDIISVTNPATFSCTSCVLCVLLHLHITCPKALDTCSISQLNYVITASESEIIRLLVTKGLGMLNERMELRRITQEEWMIIVVIMVCVVCVCDACASTKSMTCYFSSYTTRARVNESETKNKGIYPRIICTMSEF